MRPGLENTQRRSQSQESVELKLYITRFTRSAQAQVVRNQTTTQAHDTDWCVIWHARIGATVLSGTVSSGRSTSHCSVQTEDVRRERVQRPGTLCAGPCILVHPA